MTSEELNDKLRDLSDEGDIYGPKGLESSGKAIPYYGWFWRTVDFDRPIRLAYADGSGGDDVPSWVGFCEKNKWNYEEFTATREQTAEIRRLAIEFASLPSRGRAQALFDYLQGTRPEHVKGTQRWKGLSP